MIVVKDDQEDNKPDTGTGKVNSSPEVDVVRLPNVDSRRLSCSLGIGPTTGVF